MKKKSDLKKLSIMGITGALLISSQATSAEQNSADSYLAAGYGGQGGCGGRSGSSAGYGPQGGCGGRSSRGYVSEADSPMNMEKSAPGYQMQPANQGMKESELLQKLDEKHKVMYSNMSPEGKQLARQLAGQSCAGKNDCKGLNSCKTNKNDCAGKGGCKGQSPGAFKDKNQAIDVANNHMREKRMSMNQNYRSNMMNRQTQ